ncbi:hypothetical protein [Chitinophaga sp. CF418]|uniref:hypothetical protein n=1 Tax=Chitinophaga sp. CF418 TaxID=1855287 RepID=UPI000910F80F|nr:hypothetical protein [Chitinophaga sp. CF418]SHN43090.1 hypothetical protein SAMN05216311_115132 [Chitinophaga sp. CF418]
MKPVPVLLCTIYMFILSAGCRKNEESGRPILQKGLRGKILYSSCATTAVQVLNKDIGTEWTSCQDKKIYEHVIDANIVNRNSLAAGVEFSFNIVEDEPEFRCDMLDCNPPTFATIVITGD